MRQYGLQLRSVSLRWHGDKPNSNRHIANLRGRRTWVAALTHGILRLAQGPQHFLQKNKNPLSQLLQMRTRRYLSHGQQARMLEGRIRWIAHHRPRTLPLLWHQGMPSPKIERPLAVARIIRIHARLSRNDHRTAPLVRPPQQLKHHSSAGSAIIVEQTLLQLGTGVRSLWIEIHEFKSD